MDNKSNICQTCLSSDRQMYSLEVLRVLLHELDIEEIKETGGGVCWECRSQMLKFFKFKAKVKKAQNSMWDLKFKQNLNPKSLTTLSVSHKQTYDYEYMYNQLEIQTAPVFIKQESDEMEYDTDDEKPILENVNVYLELVPIEDKQSKKERKVPQKRTRKLLRSLKSEKLISEDVVCVDERNDDRSKFTKVVFTEEEVQTNREMKRSHPNFKKIPLKCSNCVQGFTRQEKYDLHMEKRHDEKAGAFLCNVCKVRFPSDAQLNQHRSQHYEYYQCNLCPYKSSVLSAMFSHCSGKHRSDTANEIHCKHCEAVVETVEELTEHVKKVHKPTCNLCGETFKGKDTLRDHKRRIHGGNRQFICDICTKTFINKTRLESHMVTHNDGIAKQLSYCAECDIQYKNIYVYRDHLRKSGNHSQELFQCPDCDKKFASKVYWKQHYNFFHLHKSQSKCEICNKVFITYWRLRNHNQKHHGLPRPRNYPCAECGKEFFSMEMLKNHQYIHSNERTFMCTDCGKTFKQSAALYNHTRIVHQGYKRKRPSRAKANKVKEKK